MFLTSSNKNSDANWLQQYGNLFLNSAGSPKGRQCYVAHLWFNYILQSHPADPPISLSCHQWSWCLSQPVGKMTIAVTWHPKQKQHLGGKHGCLSSDYFLEMKTTFSSPRNSLASARSRGWYGLCHVWLAWDWPGINSVEVYFWILSVGSFLEALGCKLRKITKQNWIWSGKEGMQLVESGFACKLDKK